MTGDRTNPTRRSVVGTTASALALSVTPSKALAVASLRSPRGPGSASGAPNLPRGFREMFSSCYLESNGIRMHAVVGGAGPPLLLVHGWPQTWYQWRLVMPALARRFTVVSIDQRGIGLSDKPVDGYDSATQARDLVGAMQSLGFTRFAVVGFDTGLPLSYALGADYPERVARLVVGEALIPGVTPSPPLLLPGPINQRFWHIAFNRVGADVNEALVRGREDIYFGSEFAVSARRPLPDATVQYYVDRIANDPHGLRGSFGWYRAIDADIGQNQRRQMRRLSIPVLAIGGAYSTGESIANTMRLVADQVQSRVIPDCGHWIAEEQPEVLLETLTVFLESYWTSAN